MIDKEYKDRDKQISVRIEINKDLKKTSQLKALEMDIPFKEFVAMALLNMCQERDSLPDFWHAPPPAV